MNAMSSPIALRVDNVFKKFKKGERHDSLRDLIPSITKRMARRIAGNVQLQEMEFWALQGISFEVPQGEALGIIGHNGAGKSTLLKHLSGLMKPTRGRIQVAGRLSALIEVGAGFHQDLTGRENVFLNGVILGMSRAEIRRKFDEIVAFAGLEEFIDTPVKRYSSGMYARLGFSVAAHMEPDILIVDEVLSVGDYVFQAKGVAKMRAVLSSGCTVIFVSHNLRSMSDLCSRAILLRKGELIEDGPTSHVIRTYMEQIKTAREGGEDKDVYIETVAVSGDDHARFDFESGEKAYVEVTLRAVRSVARVACGIYLMDEMFYGVFDTSTERLGLPSADMSAGERITYRFELNLHLAAGTFHLCALLYRYDIGKLFDQIQPAATLLIRNDNDVRGVANLYPRVVDIRRA
jgi:ABC-type polysaccharide/polyol phosphate transport system ATPase subunit